MKKCLSFICAMLLYTVFALGLTGCGNNDTPAGSKISAREVYALKLVFAAECYNAFSYIVRRDRHFDAVTQQDFDVVDAHFSGYGAHDHCAVVKLYLEFSARKTFFYNAFGLDIVTSRHTTSCPN